MAVCQLPNRNLLAAFAEGSVLRMVSMMRGLLYEMRRWNTVRPSAPAPELEAPAPVIRFPAISAAVVSSGVKAVRARGYRREDELSPLPFLGVLESAPWAIRSRTEFRHPFTIAY